MGTVVLVGTLDTKGREYAYLADRVREHGADVLLVDAGIVGEPLSTPDVTREEVAAAVGADVAALAAAGDRGAAVETMSRGTAEILKRLHAEGRLDAVGGLGGSGGSALVTYAMRQLGTGAEEGGFSDGRGRRGVAEDTEGSVERKGRKGTGNAR